MDKSHKSSQKTRMILKEVCKDIFSWPEEELQKAIKTRLKIKKWQGDVVQDFIMEVLKANKYQKKLKKGEKK